MQADLSRRPFLGRADAALAALIPGRRFLPRVAVHRVSVPHPQPRPGLPAAKLLTKQQLADTPDVRPAFEQVREIPEAGGGIRCQCGSSEIEGNCSLLSCYEGDAMARHCQVWQGQGRLAHRLHKDGKTLDEIRVAIDARYG